MAGRVVLGRYRIVAPLARGGMGIIYLGRLEGAAGFAKPVVIKTVIPDAKDTRAAQMFAREARILSNLEHPGIVGVLDFGEVDGEYIMVLEYVHGFHLGFWSRFVQEARGKMPVAHAIEVMLPVLDALDFAHRLTRADGTPLDIVHRDVSPANILLDQLGHVKLHDFGIARMADDEFKTQDGTFRGTLSFTAPETLQGFPASPRSDLYACGVILYQLLAGSNPFRGEQPSETLHRVVTFTPPPLGVVRDDVGPALDAAIAQSLMKDPAQRFESAGSFAAALRAARDWSEQEAALDLARTIQHDFASAEMPEYLGVESLQVRDAAWRASQPATHRIPLGSSHPPARPVQEQTATAHYAQVPEAATIQALPSHALLSLVRDGDEHARQASGGAESALATALAAPAVPQELARPKRRSPALFVVPGVLVAAAGVAYALVRKPAEPPPPRFLLIEKQTEPDDVQANSSGAAVAPAVSGAPSSPSGSPPASTSGTVSVPTAKAAHPAEGSAPSSGASITAAFQKQRGRVEACFRANPSDAEAPRLSVRFQIDPDGSVRAAELSPAALAGSALGSCILGVARSTHFPSGDAPLSFTIPITAKKSAG